MTPPHSWNQLCCIVCQKCHCGLILAMLAALASTPILLFLPVNLAHMACSAVQATIVCIFATQFGLLANTGLLL